MIQSVPIFITLAGGLTRESVEAREARLLTVSAIFWVLFCGASVLTMIAVDLTCGRESRNSNIMLRQVLRHCNRDSRSHVGA